MACSQCSVLYWVAMPSCARSPKRFSRAYICAYAYARYAREKLFSRKKTVGPVPWALQGCRVATPSCARSEKRFSRAYIRAYAYARYAREKLFSRKKQYCRCPRLYRVVGLPRRALLVAKKGFAWVRTCVRMCTRARVRTRGRMCTRTCVHDGACVQFHSGLRCPGPVQKLKPGPNKF